MRTALLALLLPLSLLAVPSASAAEVCAPADVDLVWFEGPVCRYVLTVNTVIGESEKVFGYFEEDVREAYSDAKCVAQTPPTALNVDRVLSCLAA